MGRKMAVHCLSFILVIGLSQYATGRPQATLGKDFKIKMVQEVDVEGTGLRVKLVSISEDSRCPSSVTCVWRGNARVVLEVRTNSTKPRQVALNTQFVQEADRDEKAMSQYEKAARAPYPFKATYSGFALRLVKLDPYPSVADKPIKQEEYVATMAVVKSR